MRAFALAALFAFASFPLRLPAQSASRAHLLVHARDPTGATIPFAEITLTSEAAPSTSPTLTAAQDGDVALEVAPGVYSISAAAPGFLSQTGTVAITPAHLAAVGLVLSVGAACEGACLVVEVTPAFIELVPSTPLLVLLAPAAPVQTACPTVGRLRSTSWRNHPSISLHL